MALTIDANVVIDASNTLSPRQRESQDAIGRALAGSEPVYLFWPVVMAYLRVSTHRRLFNNPLTIREAHRNIDQLTASDNVVLASERAGFWAAYQRVASDAGASGGLVHDAHIVTLMRQHGVATIWTYDRDFQRFPGITAVDPSAA